MVYLRQSWSRSRVFRVSLVVAMLYALLRLAVHAMFMTELLQSGQFEGHDLDVYLDAATRMVYRQDLYPHGPLADWIEFYQYSPAYALACIPLLGLPIPAVMAGLSLLHIVAYGLLYGLWGRIFSRLNLWRASDMLAWTLPIWVIFSQFWADLSYLNVYIFMALLSTLLIDATLNRRLVWSVVWLSLILQIKPQWAFPLALPLLLGQRRFFLKLLALSLVTYAAIAGATMVAVGPAYGWQQQVDYIRLLSNVSGGNYPWRGPDEAFLGYNHSITQITVYVLGIRPEAFRLATALRVLLLAPLAVVSLRHMVSPPARQTGPDDPRPPKGGHAGPLAAVGLDFAFALYLGAFIWLNVVWEVTLGIAVFTYLLATVERRSIRLGVGAVFLCYALVDFWQLASFAMFGMDVIAPGPYILTDPAIYVPLVMMVILACYAVLITRLWTTPGEPGGV